MVGAPAFMRGSSAFKPSGSHRDFVCVGFSRGVSYGNYCVALGSGEAGNTGFDIR
jgi:hypothetical protein